MENFFEHMEPWRKPEGALHLYVLPTDDDAERFQPAQDALDGVPHLPLMPTPYLHATLQRLSQFDDEVAQTDYTRLGDALGAVCSGLPAFDLDFAAFRPGSGAVESWALPSKGWDSLLASCRQCVTDVWGSPPPAPPPGPHLSLAYANGSVPNDVVAARLAEVEPLGRLRVSTLHLVSVTARPERGTFDFTALANWDLSS